MRFRSLAIAGLASLALAAIGAFVAHRELLSYERRAARHVPASARWAARIDVEQAPLYESVRQHLMPLLDRLPMLPAPGGRDPGDGGALRRRLRRDAGINLGFELREVLVAGGEGSWAIAIGGLFDATGVVDDLTRVLEAAGATGISQPRPGVVRFDPWGAWLGRADDGIVVVASDAATFADALSTGPRHERLGLPRAGALGVAIGRPSLERAAQAGALVAGLRRVVVEGTLGDSIELDARAELDSSRSPEVVRAAVASWLTTPPPGPLRDDWGQRALMARARFSEESGDILMISSHWTRTELGRALQALRAWTERRFETARAAALETD